MYMNGGQILKKTHPVYTAQNLESFYVQWQHGF